MTQANVNFALKADNISKIINDGVHKLNILEKISLELRQASSLALLGPSGCGKSTLLGILAGLDLPTHGSVFWFGEDISCLNEEDRAKKRNGKLGFVFQSFQLVNHLTALENVMLPLELARVGEAREIATEYLIKVKLENRINHFPKTLSGGEQQRVALARAFSIKPIFLFADEPTGSLDNFNGMLVKDLLF